jgi:hypothetical protein
MSRDYRYCKVFVDGIALGAAEALLGRLFRGTIERHTMDVSPGLAVDVRGNKDAGGGDDFVYWPVLVEIDAVEGVTGGAVVEAVSRILDAIWDAGHRAVAACDFEDELPWGGGIQRLRT